MRSRISIFAILAVVGMLATMVACGGGGGGEESVTYNGESDPAVFDTTTAVALAEELTLGAVHGEDFGGLGLVVIEALVAGGSTSPLALDASAEPLAYSCENGSFMGSESGTASGRACGDFDTGDLDYLSATFTNFSNVVGQVFDGELVVDVGATFVNIIFRDFSFEDSALVEDLFLDGIMTASQTGSIYSMSINLFVEDFGDGLGLWLHDLVLQVEDLGTSTVFTINGRIYDILEGYLDVETITALEFDDGVDYPKAGEVKYTGADGSSFRIVVQAGDFMGYVDLDGDGGEDWQTPTPRPWTF